MMGKNIFSAARIFLKTTSLLLVFIYASGPAAMAAPPSMSSYCAVPYFMEQASVRPNILIMLDNSGSMNEFVYAGQDYDPNVEYYGYFSPDLRYTYGSNIFDPDVDGKWSGNFLNFLTMRRIDVLRKVVAGGKANSATGDGAMQLSAESGTGDNYYHVVTYDSSTGEDVSPHEGNFTYGIKDDGTIYVMQEVYDQWIFSDYSTTYSTIKVQKNPDLEPDEFYEYAEGDLRLGGVMQKFGDDANWGNVWFVETSKSNTAQGGAIANPVSDVQQFSNLITSLRNKSCETWTPLAETFYVGMQHFKQEDVPSPLGYESGAADTNHDPFDFSEWCAKNFVLVLTDGLSTKDSNIPDGLKDYADSLSPSHFLTDEAGDGYTDSAGRYSEDGGTDFLKDVAYYARTTNLRDNIYGETNLISYYVYAFGRDNDAGNLLKEAARQGGFEDRNGNNKPDLQAEWDKNGDGVPDTYFEAQDGRNLEEELERAIIGILNRASSGTSASILSESDEGEGSMIQAYLSPSIITESGETTWLGYLQSLWIDPCGNMRDDSGATPNKLDLIGENPDKIIEFDHDEETSDTKIHRYTSHPLYDADMPYASTNCGIALTSENSSYETIDLNEVKPIFEAGKKLHETTAAQRNIFTYIEGEEKVFNTGNKSILAPYLGVNDASYDNYAQLGETDDERSETLINFIRGVNIDSDSIRNRLVTIDDTEEVWKLGDIAYSTPVTVSGAVENYHILYSDRSYNNYRNAQKSRETVVYVGANDGMLHAFTHGRNVGGNEFEPINEGEELGEEIWAYIPQALLPHLKWLADPDYCHVYYVDSKPKIFDAKIDGTWGTYLLQGLRMGGKNIWTESDSQRKEFLPTYTLIDITDPRNPEIMWERSYDGLGMSFSRPAVVRNNGNWYAVFGSGPRDSSDRNADYQGWSGVSDKSHVYVVNLADGTPVSTENDYLFTSEHTQSFFNDPASLDKNLNFNVDAIYLAETYDPTDYTANNFDQPVDWQSTIYKINIPVDWSDTGFASSYSEPSGWKMEEFFITENSVTGPVSLSQDEADNIWVYFGTGRFIGAMNNIEVGPVFDDRSDGSQQYFYGVKDPYYNENYKLENLTSYFHNNSAVLTLDRTDLFDSNSVVIGISDIGGTRVFNAGTSTLWNPGDDYGSEGEWQTLLNYTEAEKDGWYITLSDFSPSERIVSKPAILGGTVLCSSYTPISDPCLFGGNSSLYGVYYKTGTGFGKQVFDEYDENSVTFGDNDYSVVGVKTTAFVGAPPPSIGLHAGREEGATAYIQQSTGQIIKLAIDPANNIRSGLRGWKTK